MKNITTNEVIEWYKKEYGDLDSHIDYHESLNKKENIHCSLIESPFGNLYHFHSSPSVKGCKPQIWLRLEDETLIINKNL